MDAMKLAAALILAILGIAGLNHCAHAEYSLQLVVGTGDDAEVLSVDTYEHRKQCQMVANQYKLGKAVYRETLERPIREAECLSCEEWPALCVEGI